MADSFCMIPAKGDPSVAMLKEENATLKAELEKQRQQLVNMEAALKARQEQDQQLRDSIMIARKEVWFLFRNTPSALRQSVFHPLVLRRREARADVRFCLRSGPPRYVVLDCDPAPDPHHSSRHRIFEYQRASAFPGTRSRRGRQRWSVTRPPARAPGARARGGSPTSPQREREAGASFHSTCGRCRPNRS